MVQWPWAQSVATSNSKSLVVWRDVSLKGMNISLGELQCNHVKPLKTSPWIDEFVRTWRMLSKHHKITWIVFGHLIGLSLMFLVAFLTETGWFTQSSPLGSFAAFFSQRSQNGQKRRALMRLKGTTQFEWAQMGWVHQNWFAFESASYSYQRSLGQFSSTQADSFGEGDYSDLSTNWWLVRFVTPSFEVGKSHVQTCPSPMSSP